MPHRATCFLWGLLLLAPAAVHARQSKTKSIDAYCNQLRAEFASTVPYVFSGPDPWVQLDDVPAAMPDDGLAFVYTAGADIRWVFVRFAGAENHWSEDVDYFYRPDGTLAKRERHLQSTLSNIALDAVSYYVNGRAIKEKSHRHSLTPGKTDTSQFLDPGAPVFPTRDDLPFPDVDNVWKWLAAARPASPEFHADRKPVKFDLR